MTGPILTPHDAYDCYSPSHCFSHNVDELCETTAYYWPGAGWPLRCFECRHMYLTADELIEVFNEELRLMDANAAANKWEPCFSEPASSTDEIEFCPFCLHDW